MIARGTLRQGIAEGITGGVAGVFRDVVQAGIEGAVQGALQGTVQGVVQGVMANPNVQVVINSNVKNNINTNINTNVNANVNARGGKYYDHDQDQTRRTGADPRTIAALTAALKDTDKDVRETALNALVQMRDPADNPTVKTHESRGQGMMLRGIDPTNAGMTKTPSSGGAMGMG